MISLAHHWLVTYRGGEKVLAEFRLLFPEVPAATLIFKRGEIPKTIHQPGIITSPLQYFPLAAKYYKALLPLHPWAFGRLSAPANTRFVLSSDAAMVKGLKVPEGAKHVCYCHSPPRYLWAMQAEYLNNSGGLGFIGKAVFKWITPRAKAFDYAAAQRVNHFIGNSNFISERIKRCYNREATTIYPPVSVDDFSPDRPAEDFYLLVTQLTPYKRADLAVKAFTTMGKKLVVIGEGSEFESLKAMAGPTVQLLGRQPFKIVKDHFERCKAFLYPQIEDFGITAVEAQAAGKPVIAFRAGGALETVIEGQTGLFFDEQTPESLADAVHRFEDLVASNLVASHQSLEASSQELAASPQPLGASICRANAERFRPERFRAEMKAFLTKYYPDLFTNYPWPV